MFNANTNLTLRSTKTFWSLKILSAFWEPIITRSSNEVQMYITFTLLSEVWEAFRDCSSSRWNENRDQAPSRWISCSGVSHPQRVVCCTTEASGFTLPFRSSQVHSKRLHSDFPPVFCHIVGLWSVEEIPLTWVQGLDMNLEHQEVPQLFRPQQKWAQALTQPTGSVENVNQCILVEY